MISFESAQNFIIMLTGNAESVIDFRCIHDQRKDVPAHNYRGTLRDNWATLSAYNQNGYGIFCNINAMDGMGRDLANVDYIRAHVVDLDNVLTAQSNYERATQWQPAPSFAVQTSPGKFHVYWIVQPYRSNEFYGLQQRKLRQIFDGDKSVIDATRVLRVPGFFHLKAAPFLVTAWPLQNVSTPTTAEILQAALAHVNVIEHFSSRFPLGEPTMAAPSFDWLRFALSLVDPNNLDRSEWVSLSAAFKQAGWTLADDATLLNIWQDWCARYSLNDAGENLKLWNSFKDTEVGWPAFERRTPVQAYMTFGFKDAPPAQKAVQQPAAPAGMPDFNGTQRTDDRDNFGEILDPVDCGKWFKDCYFIASTGKIFSRAGRYMDSTKFNGLYGGKHFIITSTGKTTDEAWKAALRSTCFQIPKVDHIRFLPDRGFFEIITDALGREGLNTYIPANIDARAGDVTPWLDHVNRILPNKGDQKLLFDYLAHCVKFPGYKIPWAPMLQSGEGVGKTVFFEVMQHALGDMYVYSPKAQELVESGSKFNAWMRGKLMIIVNEIKVDERRELIEILKPMITDARVEVQSKGVDQDMEDNPANWLFFSNFKDAIPISKNGRRFPIFYSALQSAADILAAGMDKAYFDRLWKWLREDGGKQAVAYWLMNYPIERGALPVRAPETSSHAEALRISRSPMECVIADCVDDGVAGFRGGYVSVSATLSRVKAAGIRQPSISSIQRCLEGMGYVELGRAPRPYAQEDVNNRALIYGILSNLDLNYYGHAQGYE